MKNISILLIMFLVEFTASACLCGPYVNEFCDAVFTDSYVALVEITEIQNGSSATFRIVENIHNIIPESSIEVLGHDGVNCGLYLGQFAVGDTLVINVINGQSQNAMTYELFDWYLDDCSRRYLHYTNNIVSGGILTGLASQKYEIFKLNFNSCVQYVSGNNNVKRTQIEIYPNPVNDDLYFESNEITLEDIKLYDLYGNLILQDNRVKNSSYSLSFAAIEDGVYFVVVRTDFGIMRKKVVKITK